VEAVPRPRVLGRETSRPRSDASSLKAARAPAMAKSGILVVLRVPPKQKAALNPEIFSKKKQAPEDFRAESLAGRIRTKSKLRDGSPPAASRRRLARHLFDRRGRGQNRRPLQGE
jgi:hypothetical protein